MATYRRQPGSRLTVSITGRHVGLPQRLPWQTQAPESAYAYLLGQYLGDGSIAHGPRDVYRLFVSCCAAYPDIIEKTRAAISAVVPKNAVGERTRPGLLDRWCYSKHWPCLFPQH